MKTFAGIPVSDGIAIGRAFAHAETAAPDVPRRAITEKEAPLEIERLMGAAARAAGEAAALLERARKMGKEQAGIFQAQLFMLEDEEFLGEIAEGIRTALRCAEWAVQEMSRDLCQKLMQSPDPSLRERAADIADVSGRLIGCLLCAEHAPSSLACLGEDSIVVARDLLPSDALLLDKSRVIGIALDEGGKTSHTAILARAFGIPAVLGLSSLSRELRGGERLIVNGATGEVVVEPDAAALQRGKAERRARREREGRLAELRGLPAQTRDGRRVALLANIGFPEEAAGILAHGAEGIGLYRSEFLFMAPGRAAGEEEQLDAYGRALEAMGGRPVTIRTMDAGGDKILPELQALGEKNPLLGWRAIRLSLASPGLFKEQLRALLRASVRGNLKIMFPMICCAEEMDRALGLLDEARAECRKKGQPFAEGIEVGITVEVPSAAVCADILAEKSGFFSIGTNDLIQYAMAADRGNERVHHLSDPFQPAVLRLVKQAIDAAHEAGIKAAVCGEMAGDPAAAALLLGLGLDEFSMNAPSIPKVKEVARAADMQSCRALAAAALRAKSAAEARALAGAWMAETLPGSGASEERRGAIERRGE